MRTQHTSTLIVLALIALTILLTAAVIHVGIDPSGLYSQPDHPYGVSTATRG